MSDTVSIELEGKTFELKPTLGALEALSKKYENFQSVYTRLGSMNLEVYTDVVYAGVKGKLPPNDKERQETNAEIYNAGIITLMPSLIEFMGLLLNGGKRPSEEDNQEADEKGEGKP